MHTYLLCNNKSEKETLRRNICIRILNPLNPYQLDESTSIFRGIRSNFSFLFHFSMKLMFANRIAPDGTLRYAASHLGLFCLPMSHKKYAKVNSNLKYVMFTGMHRGLIKRDAHMHIGNENMHLEA